MNMTQNVKFCSPQCTSLYTITLSRCDQCEHVFSISMIHERILYKVTIHHVQCHAHAQSVLCHKVSMVCDVTLESSTLSSLRLLRFATKLVRLVHVMYGMLYSTEL